MLPLRLLGLVLLLGTCIQLESLPIATRLYSGGRVQRASGPMHRKNMLSITHCAVLGLKAMRGGESDSLMSIEDALSGDDEESSSPAVHAQDSPDTDAAGADVQDSTPMDAGADDIAGQSPADYGLQGTRAELSEVRKAATSDTGNFDRRYKIRPPVGDVQKGATGDALEFQLLDVDYKKLPYQRPGTAAAGKAETHEGGFTIDAFGTTAQGHSVHVAIKGFLPYFFVDIPRAFSEVLTTSLFFCPCSYLLNLFVVSAALQNTRARTHTHTHTHLEVTVAGKTRCRMSAETSHEQPTVVFRSSLEELEVVRQSPQRSLGLRY